MRDVVILSACRTAIGAFGGSLRDLPATALAKVVMLEALRRAGLEPGATDEVIFGNVLPAGLGQNPARQAMLQAGLPHTVGALTVNKVCGSGLKAVMLAAQAIQCGDADVVVAGGMENMNLAPYYLPKARAGLRMGHGSVVDGMVHDGLWDHINDFHMGSSAELIAQEFDVSRAAQDDFALESYTKALRAEAEGWLSAERCAVPLPQRKGPDLPFSSDEILRPTSADDLARLRPAFQAGGTVTAGNASKLADGAAALVVADAAYAAAQGLRPLARIVAQAAGGLDPRRVLVAPIVAVPKLLAKAGRQVADVDLWEINEAFAASSIAVQRVLGMDPARVNVHGGSIALGHPIGASGARVLVTLLHALEGRKERSGVATLCLGGGEAVALLVERV